MHSELVRAACYRIEDHVACAVRMGGDDFIFGDGSLALLLIDFLTWTLVVIRTQRKAYVTL